MVLREASAVCSTTNELFGKTSLTLARRTLRVKKLRQEVCEFTAIGGSSLAVLSQSSPTLSGAPSCLQAVEMLLLSPQGQG